MLINSPLTVKIILWNLSLLLMLWKARHFTSDYHRKRSNYLNNTNKARKGNGNFQFHCINFWPKAAWGSCRDRTICWRTGIEWHFRHLSLTDSRHHQTNHCEAACHVIIERRIQRSKKWNKNEEKTWQNPGKKAHFWKSRPLPHQDATLFFPVKPFIQATPHESG